MDEYRDRRNLYGIVGALPGGAAGTGESGVLSIIVNTLSPFMVEVPAADTRTVTVSAAAGGAVSPSGKVNLPDGESKTFTVLPDEGYAVDSVTLDGVTPLGVTGNSFTLTDITRNHSVNVSFRQVTPSETMHTVTITEGGARDAQSLRHGTGAARLGTDGLFLSG